MLVCEQEPSVSTQGALVKHVLLCIKLVGVLTSLFRDLCSRMGRGVRDEWRDSQKVLDYL